MVQRIGIEVRARRDAVEEVLPKLMDERLIGGEVARL